MCLVRGFFVIVLLKYSESLIVLNHNTNDSYEICESGHLCVRKCCPEQHVFKSKRCVLSDLHNFTFQVYDGVNDVSNNINVTFNVIHIKQCTEKKLKLSSESKDKFYIQKNGQMYKPNDELSPRVNFWDYCLETFIIGNTSQEFSALVCYNKTILVMDIDDYYSIGMIISMPFLLITFLVYLVLPDSNIHRKALMFYVMSLLIAYICLVCVQLYREKIEAPACEALGLCIIFFFLVSFFWMNVMCIDIFLAFRGFRGFTGKKSAETKRFLLYCLYALGLPTLHVLLLLTLNRVVDSKSDYSPQIGKTKCFLEDGIPNLLYFYGPMGVLLTINIILFILTAIKIQQVKKETSMLKHSDSKRHSYENDKQKFNLYVKLLLAMGVNWIMEIISWAFIWKMGQDMPNSVWYLTDFVNAMYGVLIFFIFVFKRKIWKSLQKRYYVFIGKPHLAHSTTMTQTTRSSNYSTTDTGLTEHRLSELRNGRAEERALTSS